MRPKHIVLVRHAESEANVDESIMSRLPDHKVPVSAEGHRQARYAGERLKGIVGDIDIRFYISPHRRTRQTYEGMASVFTSEIRCYEDLRLREQEFGHFLTPEDIEGHRERRAAYGRLYYRPRDGESGADVYDRVSTFLESMHRDFAADTFPDAAVIVTHSLTLRLFLMRWFHWSVEFFESVYSPKNCGFAVMRKNDAGRYDLEADFMG